MKKYIYGIFSFCTVIVSQNLKFQKGEDNGLAMRSLGFLNE